MGDAPAPTGDAPAKTGDPWSFLRFPPPQSPKFPRAAPDATEGDPGIDEDNGNGGSGRARREQSNAGLVAIQFERAAGGDVAAARFLADLSDEGDPHAAAAFADLEDLALAGDRAAKFALKQVELDDDDGDDGDDGGLDDEDEDEDGEDEDGDDEDDDDDDAW